jgi:hypothetical protein
MSRLLAFVAIVFALALPVSAASASRSTLSYNEHFSGVEVLPVTSTLGTFTGIATGDLPGGWYAQVEHQPLSTSTVDITGGSFTLHPLLGRKIQADISSGSVTPDSAKSSSDGCTRQAFDIDVTLADGHGNFEGTLTHYGFKFLGSCVVYSASIVGDGSISR